MNDDSDNLHNGFDYADDTDVDVHDRGDKDTGGNDNCDDDLVFFHLEITVSVGWVVKTTEEAAWFC